MKLKQSNIDTIKIVGGRSETIVFDDDLPGFGLRIREGGSRNFIVQYKTGIKQRRLTLGSTKMLTVEQARESAKDVFAKVRLGGDPAGDKISARAVVSELSLGAIVEQYLARQSGRLRPSSFKSAELYLRRYLKSLHHMRLDEVKRADIAARLSAIAAMNGAVTADRVRSNISSLYAWAIGEGLCEANPVIGTNKHDDSKPRDRVLGDDELVSIWNALPAQHYGSVVKLLMLTGCRADEIGWLEWSEVDLDERVIHLPAERVKNGNAFDVPLSDMAVDILANTPRRGGHVFGIRNGGFQGWSKSKYELDAKLSIAAWRVHDIRRSVATGMAELGVQPHIVEACLNHLSGHKRGVAGIYNKATYLTEKREALELWANHIAVILAGNNVTKLRPRKKA
jgi:integrase